nr:hypothetical protein [uncultured Cohaesibacter sp.]
MIERHPTNPIPTGMPFGVKLKGLMALMTDKTNSGHVYLKDRMSGYRGWLKILVYTLSGIVMVSFVFGNLMQGF